MRYVSRKFSPHLFRGIFFCDIPHHNYCTIRFSCYLYRIGKKLVESSMSFKHRLDMLACQCSIQCFFQFFIPAHTADWSSDTVARLYLEQFLCRLVDRQYFCLTCNHKTVFHIFCNCQIFFMTFFQFLDLSGNLSVLFMYTHQKRP